MTELKLGTRELKAATPSLWSPLRRAVKLLKDCLRDSAKTFYFNLFSPKPHTVAPSVYSRRFLFSVQDLLDSECFLACTQSQLRGLADLPRIKTQDIKVHFSRVAFTRPIRRCRRPRPADVRGYSTRHVASHPLNTFKHQARGCRESSYLQPAHFSSNGVGNSSYQPQRLFRIFFTLLSNKQTNKKKTKARCILKCR